MDAGVTPRPERSRLPPVARERDEAARVEDDTFFFEQATLERGVFTRAERHPRATRVLFADDAMPRQARRTVAHRPRDDAVPRANAEEIGELTVGDDAASRDRAHELVDLLVAHSTVTVFARLRG